MEGLITRSCKLVGLAGAVLALSLMAGCSNAPDPAQRAINAANRADQAASRAEAASDAKAAADRAEAIASKSMSSYREGGRRSYRRHRKAAAEAAPSGGDSGG